MKSHPFPAEREIGTVFAVDGAFADIALLAANKLPRSHLGEHLGRGEVGQFVIIEVNGVAVFGRIIRVGAPTANLESLTSEQRSLRAEARVQLLSTLHLDGSSTRGIVAYPRVGDSVFAASGEAVTAVLGTAAVDGQGLLLGHLSIDESVAVHVPLERLFGRHLAVVGATGSGKSWTLGHLAESVGSLGGKLLLIDATGEFASLGTRAKHLAFGSTQDEPAGTTLVGIPHFMMRESDRNAFLSPSSGTQLPKLREAVRSLRLAHAIQTDASCPPQVQGLVSNGTLPKAGVDRTLYGHAAAHYSHAVQGAESPFDIRLLASQVELECVWPSGQGGAAHLYGGLNNQELGYVGSLISRINDLLQLQEVMTVIEPNNQVSNVIAEMQGWTANPNPGVLRISLRNLTFANHLREIVVNILGQTLLGWARTSAFRVHPLVVAVDEAHQFFDVTVGDEFASTHLNAFDAIAKEGRKYGLTVCVATQRPGDLPAGVLSQVGMTIVHRLADGRDRQRVEQAAAELDHSATKLLPGLVPGEAVLMGVDFPVPVSVRVQRPVSPPHSQGPQFHNWTP